MNAIEISALCKTFKGKKGATVEALKELSLTVAQGEVFGFLGPNGAGKSTTIKSLAGLIRPTSGYARVMGIDVSCHDARRAIGYLPENPAFYDYLSAKEYLLFVGRIFGLSENLLLEQCELVLNLLDLWEARNRPIRGYSKGMVQRLGLAQVLIHDPDVYILDEPMSGLDPVGRALVKQILVDLKKKGKTVFFSTHVTSDVEAVCDRVAILAKGELCSVNVVAELLEEGVEGYRVLLEEEAPPAVHDFLVSAEASECVFYVPRLQFSSFMRKVDAAGCTIQLVEPRRKSLEDFFLKAIA